MLGDQLLKEYKVSIDDRILSCGFAFLALQWIELHGDRGGFDDPALVCGIGSMDGMSFVFIGHQKGRNTKENIHRNFAMPMPNGYVFTSISHILEKS